MRRVTKGALLASAILAAAITGGAKIGTVSPLTTQHVAAAIDGDTLDVDGERIRLLGVDAPELTRSRCDAEHALAVKARDRLQTILKTGKIFVNRGVNADGSGDRYGRTLAHVLVNGSDVGDVLVAEHLALEWHPGAGAKAARLAIWCQGD